MTQPLMEEGKIVQRLRRLNMVLAKKPFPKRKRLLIQRFCLFLLALPQAKICQPIEWIRNEVML